MRISWLQMTEKGLLFRFKTCTFLTFRFRNSFTGWAICNYSCNNYVSFFVAILPLQNVPFPTKPAWHWHEAKPDNWTQFADLWQLCSVLLHASIFWQSEPLPENPCLHWQMKDPCVSMHDAFWWQVALNRHSSILEQFVPFPVNPEVHMQNVELSFLVQFAFSWQTVAFVDALMHWLRNRNAMTPK